MTKIVYNACHGGFGLSDDAIRRYAQIKGIQLFPEPSRFGFTTWWTKAPGERGPILSEDEFHSASMEKRAASNATYSVATLEPRMIGRADPVLVQVVEEMGASASGRHAVLEVRDLPPGTRYRIDEYDGYESVVTIDEYDWQTA